MNDTPFFFFLPFPRFVFLGSLISFYYFFRFFYSSSLFRGPFFHFYFSHTSQVNIKKYNKTFLIFRCSYQSKAQFFCCVGAVPDLLRPRTFLVPGMCQQNRLFTKLVISPADVTFQCLVEKHHNHHTLPGNPMGGGFLMGCSPLHAEFGQ